MGHFIMIVNISILPPHLFLKRLSTLQATLLRFRITLPAIMGTGEKDTFLPANSRLTGPANLNCWLLLISAVLLSLGLVEFLTPPPEDQTPSAARRWELHGTSDHSKAYGHVIKNIDDQTLMEEALNYRSEGRPLHELISHFRSLQRSELEIAIDIDNVHWKDDDSIDAFFRRGKVLFTEMRSAHPGSLSEFSFLTRMLSKLPDSYAASCNTITGSKSLTGVQMTLEEAISYLKQAEIRAKTSRKRSTSPSPSSPPKKSTKESEIDTPASSTPASTTTIPSQPPHNSTSIAMFVESIKGAVRSSLLSFNNKGIVIQWLSVL